MCGHCRDHFEDCSVRLGSSHTHWSSFIATTCPPHTLCASNSATSHPQQPMHTHTPAWTNQTFGGQLIHSHLHNEAFVTHCPILPKEHTATAHRAHCSTQTRSQEIRASTQNVSFNFPSTSIRALKHKRGGGCLRGLSTMLTTQFDTDNCCHICLY